MLYARQKCEIEDTRERPDVDGDALSVVLRPRLREKGGALSGCPKGVIIVTDKNIACECSRRTSQVSVLPEIKPIPRRLDKPTFGHPQERAPKNDKVPSRNSFVARRDRHHTSSLLV